MLVRAPESRPPRSIDYAARLVTLALPGRAAAKVDQARRDLSLLADAARGHRPAPVATLDTAVQCAPALSELDTLDALPGFLAGPAKSARRDVRVLAINSNYAVTHPADSFKAMTDRVEREGGSLVDGECRA